MKKEDIARKLTLEQLESLLQQLFKAEGIGKCCDRWIENCKNQHKDNEECKQEMVHRLWVGGTLDNLMVL